MTETTKKYIGLLTEMVNHEDVTLLGIQFNEEDEPEILAEIINDDIDEYGWYLSVRYYISEHKTTFEEIEEKYIETLFGVDGKTGTNIDYSVAYSEVTGYLWTDEDIMIGGHDLLDELKNSIGKYLYMEIIYNTEPIANSPQAI